MNTTTSNGTRYSDTESVIDHAQHLWEEWHAYLSCDDELPEWVDGDASGICCHSCSVIVVESSIY
jgi:hypothetical protein